MTLQTQRPRLVHGAAAIAEALDLPSTRATFNLLSTGKIVGARKLGGRWRLNLDVFEAWFEGGKPPVSKP